MRALFCVIACVLALAGAAGARAHSLPYGVALVWADPASGALPVIVTNRGLVFSDGAGAELRFSLRCNEAYGANTSDRPLAYLDASGELVIGIYNRVYRTRDRGCSLSQASGLPDLSLSSLISSPSAPERMYVATRILQQQAGVFASVDRGLTFSEVIKHKTSEYFETMVVAPSDPLRLYALRIRFDTAATQVIYTMAVSRDGAKTWQDHALPGKTIPLGVHPSKPDVLFAYQPTDRFETNFDIKRSDNAGESFETVVPKALQPTGFAAGKEPGTLYLGVFGQSGLYQSRDDGRSFAPLLAEQVLRVTCLAQHAGKLWLCANLAPNLDAIWTLKDDASGFDKVMTFDQVQQPVACSGAADEVCTMAWHDYALELLSPDAGTGTADAGADGGAEADGGAGALEDGGEQEDSLDEAEPEPEPAIDSGAERAKRPKPGCQLTASGKVGPGVWPWLAALALWLVRRRSRATARL